jgi:esterase/lipase superfamily enzyme
LLLKMQMRPLLALLIALLLTGCVGDKAEYVHSVWATPGAVDQERTVYFATDRAADKDWQGGFGKHWADNLTCGSVVAVVPPDQMKDEPTGRLKPNSAAAMSCGGDAADFAHAIATEARARNCNEVLLYVHGFNTLFEGAVLRAGQLALDTRSDCIAAMFSWSSEGEIGRYVADIEHSAYAVPELEAVLRALAQQGMRVDIVAHSIGVRITLAAFSSMAHHPDPPPHRFVGEMILAAGDVGADPLNNDFAHLVLHDSWPFVWRTTIYASSQDAVLAVSAAAHGDVPRAGRRPAGDRKLVLPAIIEVIDASDAPAELLGHSYFGMSREMVGDIAAVLRGEDASKRAQPPATLVCKPPEGSAACDEAEPDYVLVVSPDRRPGPWTRLVRHLAPLVPRIELAPLTSGE